MLDRIQNMSRTSVAATAIALAIVLFLAINLISSLLLTGSRIDATERKLYSVSQDTITALQSLEEPVVLRLYLSTHLRDDLPAVRVYSLRVIEMLRTFERLSRGMVDIDIINPLPLSVDEDEAVGYQLYPVAAGGGEGYFGLVGTNTVDGLETIPYLDPGLERSLEYDLARLVARLSRTVEPTIAIVDGLGVSARNDQGQRSQLIEALDQDFNLLTVPIDFTNIPDEGIDALMVIHPYALSQPARYAIDQYVIKGGRVLLLLDSLAEHSAPHPNNPLLPAYPYSDLAPVLAAWGLSIDVNNVVGDPENAVRVQTRTTGEELQFLPWIIMAEDNFNPADPVTSPLLAMWLPSAGSLTPIPGATTTFTPLITTSQAGGLVERNIAAARDAGAPANVRLNVRPMGPQVVAARLGGNVRTAFPDGPPPPVVVQGEPIGAPQDPVVLESVRPISVIVIADADFIFDDRLQAPGGGVLNNDAFVTNALESLVGGIGLTELRVRGEIARPFSRLNDIVREATQTYQAPLETRRAEFDQAQLELTNILARVPGGQIEALPADARQRAAELSTRSLELRREIRDLESQLRAELDAVDLRLRLLNILVVPGIIILLGIGFAVWRRARLARYLRSRKAATA